MNKYASPSPGAGDRLASERRDAIVDLVGSRRIGSQAELASLVRRRGFRAAQATLSRDLKSLGIGKRPSSEGSYYALPAAPQEILDSHRRDLEIASFVLNVRAVQNLLLVRTPPGNANGVGRAIDLFGWPEVAGTVAGDDTVLVITETRAAAERLRRRLAGGAAGTRR